MKTQILGILMWFCSSAIAQDSVEKTPWQWNAYVDVYTGIGSQKLVTVPYFVSANRLKQFQPNVAFIQAAYSRNKLHAKFALGTGTYFEANYTNEPKLLQNVMEANIGMELTAQKWQLDVGVLTSPFTNETAISKDHICYTRALAGEYVPYYLTGARLTIPHTKKWSTAWYLLNGWQQIGVPSQHLAFAVQSVVTTKKNHQWYIDSYVGNEHRVNPNFGMRYFLDSYWVTDSSKRLFATACTSVGWQEQKNELKDGMWWQANVAVGIKILHNLRLNLRGEIFNDPQHIQLSTLNTTNDQILSGTIGCNVQVNQHVALRSEGRFFKTKQSVYSGKDSFLWWVNGVVIAL